MKKPNTQRIETDSGLMLVLYGRKKMKRWSNGRWPESPFFAPHSQDATDLTKQAIKAYYKMEVLQ